MTVKARIALLFILSVLAALLAMGFSFRADAGGPSPIGKDGRAVKPTVSYSYTLPGTVIEHYNPANLKRKRYARIPWRKWRQLAAQMFAPSVYASNQDPGGGGFYCYQGSYWDGGPWVRVKDPWHANLVIVMGCIGSTGVWQRANPDFCCQLPSDANWWDLGPYRNFIYG